jgi:hypothetical protein
MKLNTSLVTLLTGLVLGAGVLVTSAVWPSGTSAAVTSPGGAYGTTSPASPVPAATTATPTPAASPSPTVAPATAASTSPATATATATAPATAPAATSSTRQADVPSMADYVSQVKGGGAAVAISVHGDKAVAYICNGHAVAAWLKGSAVGGTLNLTGKNGAHLSLNYRKSFAAGSFAADGTKYRFSAPLVHRVSSVLRPPGLYEATGVVHGVMIKAGWIVLPNGSQIGSVEYETGFSVLPTAQAPVLNLATGTAQYDGITLVASPISGVTGSGF